MLRNLWWKTAYRQTDLNVPCFEILHSDVSFNPITAHSIWLTRVYLITRSWCYPQGFHIFHYYFCCHRHLLHNHHHHHHPIYRSITHLIFSIVLSNFYFMSSLLSFYQKGKANHGVTYLEVQELGRMRQDVYQAGLHSHVSAQSELHSKIILKRKILSISRLKHYQETSLIELWM